MAINPNRNVKSKHPFALSLSKRQARLRQAQPERIFDHKLV